MSTEQDLMVKIFEATGIEGSTTKALITEFFPSWLSFYRSNLDFIEKLRTQKYIKGYDQIILITLWQHAHLNRNNEIEHYKNLTNDFFQSEEFDIVDKYEDFRKGHLAPIEGTPTNKIQQIQLTPRSVLVPCASSTPINVSPITTNLVEFDESKVSFLTPRGRYMIELNDSFLRMRGNKYDHKIEYDDISKIFYLPKSDDIYMVIVISLDRLVRQGQQVYQYLVLQTSKESSELSINLDEETLKREYNGTLQPVMRGNLSELIVKTFKAITGKRVFMHGTFTNSHKQACVKCALRAIEGDLYPLGSQLIFIHEPPVLIRFEMIESIEFQRYSGERGSSQSFDLCVKLITDSNEFGIPKEYIFSGIDRNEYACLFSFLSAKKIKIIGSETATASSSGNAKMHKDNMEYESSDDVEKKSNSDLMKVVRNMDEKETPKKKKRKKEAKKRSIKNISNNEKNSATNTSVPVTSSTVKNKKQKKDPNAPKKNLTSFILFSHKVREEVKAENPDVSFADLNRSIGAKFKNLSAEERKKWDDIARKDKLRYDEEMEEYPIDSLKPKSKLNAYNFFARATSKEIKDKNPDLSLGEQNSLVSEEYKKLSSEEREIFDEMARKDKLRYEKEMENYTPSKLKGKSSKKKKDPNAPRKFQNAYFHFCNNERENIRSKTPNIKFGDLSRQMGIEFKKLSKEEREKWERKAIKDKERYKKEMAKYELSKKEEQGTPKIEESNSTSSEGELVDD